MSNSRSNSITEIFKERRFFSFSIKKDSDPEKLALFGSADYQTDRNIIYCYLNFYKAFLLTKPKINPVLEVIYELSNKTRFDTKGNLYKITLYLIRNLVNFGRFDVGYIKTREYNWSIQWLQAFYLNNNSNSFGSRINDVVSIHKRGIKK
jgi:hypothetical protein